MSKTNQEIASRIHELDMDESEANRGYAKFLADFGDLLDTEDAAQIAEIVADEKSHSLILQAMALKYDGCIGATNEDEAKEAIKTIKKAMKD